MSISMEDKMRVCARAFYQDNQDQYEDYHEAQAEFMSRNNVSDSFVEFCVRPYLKPIDGHTLFIRDDGHMITYREADGYVEPVFDMTDDEGIEMQDRNIELLEKFPDIGPHEMLSKLGWRLIEPTTPDEKEGA